MLIEIVVKMHSDKKRSNPAVERDSHKLRLWFPPLGSGCPSLLRKTPMWAKLAAAKKLDLCWNVGASLSFAPESEDYQSVPPRKR